ncbi:hypothetical protein EZV62_001718 [Acer yangbiense]|uniref:Aminotransferase-like plant mobile domain-containing protein n=1 Tax=Acer yangbiense TaxID=1000413 RepID=A0A5C7IVN6_9ROSI|nr:hypothetical protein EZV62_001718 [Acer yangbiense]
MDKSEQGGREEEEPWISGTLHYITHDIRFKTENGETVIREKKNGGSDKTTSTTNLSKPKIGKRAWINYFKLECKKKDANRNSKSRSEIGNIWHLLPIEEKTRFGQPDVVEKLSEEQKEVVRALGFGNLLALNFLGISDQGDQISIYGDVPNIDFWKSKFAITSRGIFLKDIEHCLKEMTTADDEFKVTLCLFLLGTITCPLATDYVQTGYLIPLRDVGIALLALTIMGASNRG